VEIAGAGNVDTVIIDGIVRKRTASSLSRPTCSPAGSPAGGSGARIMRDAGYRVTSAPD
jgi:hypothetical protein